MQPSTDDHVIDPPISQQKVEEEHKTEGQTNNNGHDNTTTTTNNSNSNHPSVENDGDNQNETTQRTGLTIINIISKTPNLLPLSPLSGTDTGTKATSSDYVIAQSTDSIVTNNTDVLSNSSNDSVSSETPLNYNNNNNNNNSGETVKKVSPALQRLRNAMVPSLKNLNMEQLAAISNSQTSPTNQTTPTAASSTSPQIIPPTRAPSLPLPASMSIQRGRSFSLSISPNNHAHPTPTSSPRTHVHTPPPLAAWDSLMSLIQPNNSPPGSPNAAISESNSMSNSSSSLHHPTALASSSGSNSPRQRATSFRSPDQGAYRHWQKKAMMEKLEQSQLIRDKKHKTLIERQHKRILHEVPRAVELDLFEHAYPILLKSCQQYIKHLGNKHVVTLQAMRRLQHVASILGREYEL